MDRSEHVKQVHEWVEKNMQRFSTPKYLVIDDIEFDWADFGGSFSLQLDEVKIEEKFDLSLGIDGKYYNCVPIFGSPLGAPASFAAIELSVETGEAITKALNQMFPKMLPFGLHPVSKQFINSRTPVSERILDKNSIKPLKKLITSGKARIKIHLD
jgi:hypothetical protein